MAGSQDPNDNPVAINVVPMVDVIFCLCVFFMCSFKFKQIEGKFDSWLPRDKGLENPNTLPTVIDEIRIAMFYDEKTQTTARVLGARRVKDDAELQQLVKSAYSDHMKLSKGPDDQPSVTIDADAKIPWHEVVTVINLCARESIRKIEFAFGAAK